VPELLHAHLRLALGHDAGRYQRRGHLLARKADQRGPFGGGSARRAHVAARGGGVVDRNGHAACHMGDGIDAVQNAAQ